MKKYKILYKNFTLSHLNDLFFIDSKKQKTKNTNTKKKKITCKLCSRFFNAACILGNIVLSLKIK